MGSKRGEMVAQQLEDVSSEKQVGLKTLLGEQEVLQGDDKHKPEVLGRLS